MYILIDSGGLGMKTYSVFSMKGGTGKTTTVLSLLSYFGSGAVELFKDVPQGKALAVDFDPQESLTLLTGAQAEKTIVDVLTDEADIADCIVKTSYGDVLPGSQLLVALESQLQGENLIILRDKLQQLKKKYDYIFIDCQPGVSGLPIAALIASDGVVVPAQASLTAMYSLSRLVPALETARKYNKKLKVDGVLLTMFDGRTNASKSFLELAERIAADQLKTKVFETKIRRGVVIEEAAGVGKGLFEVAAKSNPAIDYANFIKELLG